MISFEGSWSSPEVLENWKTNPGITANQPHINPWKSMEHFILEAISLHIDDKNMIRNSQHGFTKGKSCLTHLVTFYEEATSWMGEREAVDIVSFSKASDTVCHEILTGKLKKSTLDERIENWLNSRFWGSLSTFIWMAKAGHKVTDTQQSCQQQHQKFLCTCVSALHIISTSLLQRAHIQLLAYIVAPLNQTPDLGKQALQKKIL